jgi:hypothetical protein
MIFVGPSRPNKNREEVMIILKIAPVLAIGFILCSVGSVNAKTYCAHYIGGPERIAENAPRSQCVFATLADCRASVRERGGGTCYGKGDQPRELGR